MIVYLSQKGNHIYFGRRGGGGGIETREVPLRGIGIVGSQSMSNEELRQSFKRW